MYKGQGERARLSLMVTAKLTSLQYILRICGILWHGSSLLRDEEG
jgi:hypothetical protein